MEKITKGKFVSLTYEVYSIEEGERELMYTFDNNRPDSFVYGLEQGMLEGFLSKLDGLKVGDTFDFTLEPSEAFGEHNPEYVMDIDKSIFFVDGKFDDEKVFAGNVIPMVMEGGYRVQGIVLEVTDTNVKMDFNHPLAGAAVQYVGKVVEVREASEAEKKVGCGGCGSGSCGGNCGGCGGC